MPEELARLQKILETGQRLSGQGSYERRTPHKEAVPYLTESRKGLRQFLREQPKSAEAWLLLSLAEECLLNYPAALQSLEHFLALGGERNKKTLKRLANLKEYGRKWAELMLSPDNLESLGVFLDGELAKSSCDHSHRLTKSWLASHITSNQAHVLEALRKSGGYCDCEVLFNVVGSS
ncbi:MAG: DUF2695 domain-containing protein [Candidatus Obscuribacterales bacterium]|nr:DUF2695 domain-containing protein [Candidatus Obscuribacterales bacterium]